MQYVPATQDSAGPRSALLDVRLNILGPIALILVAAAGGGMWWLAELGRFWG